MTGPRTILITGATDGLGQALAHRLTTDGATVLLHGRDQEKLDRTRPNCARFAAPVGPKPSAPTWPTSLRSGDSQPKRARLPIG